MRLRAWTVAIFVCGLQACVGGDVSGGESPAGDGDGSGDPALLVQVVDDGGATLVAPSASLVIAPGALPDELEISIAEVAEDELAADLQDMPGARYAGPLVAFTPHGLTFDKPVLAELDYAGLANAVGRLDDEADRVWELVPNPRFEDGKAKFEIDRFSIYVALELPTDQGCGEGMERVRGNCVDIDECATDNGGCGDAQYVTCENVEGAAPTCVDIDECATDNGGCGDAQYVTCENVEGAAPTCADIDECATDNGGCGDAQYVTCENVDGGAPTCVDIDECAANNGGCGDAQYVTCQNVQGGAPSCADIDECAVNNGGCGDAQYVTCQNVDGGAPTCADIDECAVNNGGCGDVRYFTCEDRAGAAPACRSTGIVQTQLAFETEAFDLEGDAEVGDPYFDAAPGWDFHFAYNSNFTPNAVLFQNQQEGVAIAHFPGTAFEAVGDCEAKSAQLSTSLVDVAMDTGRVVVLRTGDGAYYKIRSVSESGTHVTFEYAALSPDRCLAFETETFDLEADAEVGDPNFGAAPGWDFHFAYNSNFTPHAVLFQNQQEGVRISHLPMTAFDSVDDCAARDATYTTQLVDVAMDTGRVVLVHTAADRYYKLRYLEEIANQALFTYEELFPTACQ